LLFRGDGKGAAAGVTRLADEDVPLTAWVRALRAEGPGGPYVGNNGLLFRTALDTTVKDRHFAENSLKHLELPSGIDSRLGFVAY
jgi:hypothetical protein